MKYVVQITEYLQKECVVDAATQEDALALVRNACDEGRVTLDLEDSTKVSVDDITSEYSEEDINALWSLEDIADT